MEKEVKDAAASKKPDQAPENVTNNEVVTESNHNNKKVLVIVLVVIGVLTFMGIDGAVLLGTVFKSASEKLVEEATNSDITVNKDGSTTYESKDGSYTVSDEQKLPTDFPKDIPLLSDQKITSSYKNKTSSGSIWQIETEVKTTVSKTVEDLKSKYASWELTSDIENDGNQTMIFDKGSFTTTLNVSESNNVTKVIYTILESINTENSATE